MALGSLSAVTTQCLCSLSKKVKAGPHRDDVCGIRRLRLSLNASVFRKKIYNILKHSAPLTLRHTSVSASSYKGMIINLLLPLAHCEQQHFDQSCIPSLACVWEGVCSLCTTSTPCRQQRFVCVYCSELFSHSHQALWVCQKFARFSGEEQVFQMLVDFK